MTHKLLVEKLELVREGKSSDKTVYVCEFSGNINKVVEFSLESLNEKAKSAVKKYNIKSGTQYKIYKGTGSLKTYVVGSNPIKTGKVSQTSLNEATNMTVSKEIVRQIGNKALYMIGAKKLVGSNDGLQFRIGRNSKGVNVVRITLTSMDLYDVEYLSVRGTSVKTKSKDEGIYNDMLLKSIEKHTGLATSL